MGGLQCRSVTSSSGLETRHTLHVGCAEGQIAHGALAVAVAQVVLNALTAEQVEAPRLRNDAVLVVHGTHETLEAAEKFADVALVFFRPPSAASSAAAAHGVPLSFLQFALGFIQFLPKH